MIVFGGGIDQTRRQTSTTEIHILGSSRWDTVAPLPESNWDIAGITVDNAVYGIGKFSFISVFIYINPNWLLLKKISDWLPWSHFWQFPVIMIAQSCFLEKSLLKTVLFS